MTVIHDPYQNSVFRPELDRYLISGASADTEFKSFRLICHFPVLPQMCLSVTMVAHYFTI